MWYRIAQQTSLKSSLIIDPNQTQAVFTSPKGKDGYPLYPTVIVHLKFDNAIVKFWHNVKNEVESKIKTEIIPKILEDILEVFVKYPPGVLPKLTNNVPVNIISKCNHKYLPFAKGDAGEDISGQNSAGYYRSLEHFIMLEYTDIKRALDHELGHAFDRSNFFPGLIPGGESHTGYGKNNAAEGFAVAYDLLAQRGINYRFPIDDENSIKHNLILDHVADKIRSKGIENFKDFGTDIKYIVRTKNDFTPRKNLLGARITSLVGGFQSAYDRYQGDKGIFLNKLFNDKQIQNDIVAYINKIEFPFSITPATKEEINIALESFRKSTDKKLDDKNKVENDKLTARKKTPKDEKKYNILKSSRYLLPKSIKEFFVKNPKFSGFDDLEPKLFINEINASFINDPLVHASEEEYYASQDIINYFSNKNLIGNYAYEMDSFKKVLDKLIINIFPNLEFTNPEDYLFYDFHKSNDNSYELDIDAIRLKVVQVVNSDVNLKNLPDNRKNILIDNLIKAIQNYADYTKKLINQYETGNTGKFISNQFNTLLNRKDNLPLAKKAVDKLFLSNIPRKNLLFMRIYNNSKLSEEQKQELLNYYKAKQTQVGK